MQWVPLDPPHPSNNFKIAFSCYYRSFKLLLMPFGVKNAPLHFQQAMNIILGHLVDICVLNYLDNILIYLNIAEDHTKLIVAVLEWLTY